MSLILSGTNGLSDVDGSAATPAIRGTDTNTGIFFPAADTVGIATNGTERARVDSAGNLGLGVTPSAWSLIKALQLPSGVYLGSYTGGSNPNLYLGANNYFNGTNFIYSGSYAATKYEQVNGTHAWYTAASGTAGNAITFTQAMTLGSDGKLSIGTTGTDGNAGYGNITLNGTNGAILDLRKGDTTYARIIADTNVMGVYSQGASSILALGTNNTERLRIASNGVLTSLPTYNNVSGGSPNMFVQTDGTIYRGTSALKYKQDVRDLELIDINKFRPVRYKSKCEADDQTVDYFGLIADEVDAAGIKELVIYGADGEVENFSYDRLTVVLVKAIQEQQALIVSMREELNALKTKVGA